MPGYCGKILRVDLGRGSWSVERPGAEFFRTYFGGRNLVAYYLLREVEAGIDPLGSKNKLIFAAGTLTGVPFAGSGRHSVGAKSPLTGGFGDAEAGGFWGAELKRAGWDAVIVEGASPRPVYLWIRDDQVEIREAGGLWGKELLEVQEGIRAELGDKRVRVAMIGPAGERLVRYAAINNDLTAFAGRCGLGAVMGSKRLKAVAVRGTGTVETADPSAVGDLARYMGENYFELSGGLYDSGTAGGVLPLNAGGGLPTRNFSAGQFEGAEKISGQVMRDTILVDRGGCYACPIRCKRVVSVDDRYRVNPGYGGPEYETIASIGSNCGVDDLQAIAYGNQRLGALGLDSISTGVAIAFAMECFENGLLTKEDTGGIDLRFGNAEAMLEMIERIARRDGLGDLLAEGVRRASEKIGPESRQFAMEIKGQEIPMHDPRIKFGLGLGYAVSPTGADHNHNIHDTWFARRVGPLEAFGVIRPVPIDDLGPEKVRMVLYMVNWRHFQNCAVTCYFVPWTPHQTVGLVRAVTGWETSLFELVKIGERAANLTRLFNLREGVGPETDRLVPRFHQAQVQGPAAGMKIGPEDLEAAVGRFYQMMGWTERTGVPRRQTLEELDLGWAAAYIRD